MLLPLLDRAPPGVALDLAGYALSWRELADRARAHAAELLARGLAPGDRVAVWADSSPTTAIALVGHLLAGIASVPINPAIGAAELAHVLRDAAPRCVVGAVPRDRVDTVPVMAVGEARRGPALPEPDPGSAALVLYTSGTTGAPKGAVLTRANLAHNLDALARAWDWSADDVLVHALPLFHVHGLALGLLGPLRRGCAARILPRFDPAALCAALANGATLLFAVPTMYHRLAELAEKDPSAAAGLARARLLVSGSAPLPLREHARVERTTGQRVLERYGLTETLINASARAAGPRRPGSVGTALEGVELRLVDERRVPLAALDDATLGEVAVRGPNVFAGYLDRPEATAAVLDPEGWFYTGDLGTMAPDGSLCIAGRRATDLIKTGGFKVGAGEVEGSLLEHPSVREAAVVGLADEDLGERIVAFVVLQEAATVTAEELTAHVAAALAPHKRPRQVRFVPALPRNALGKVLKSELRRGP